MSPWAIIMMIDDFALAVAAVAMLVVMTCAFAWFGLRSRQRANATSPCPQSSSAPRSPLAGGVLSDLALVECPKKQNFGGC